MDQTMLIEAGSLCQKHVEKLHDFNPHSTLLCLRPLGKGCSSDDG